MHQVQDKDLAFFTTLLIQVSVSIGISLTCGKHLHDCIISLGGEVRDHKTRVIPLIFIEVPVIVFRGIDFVSVSMIYISEL